MYVHYGFKKVITIFLLKNLQCLSAQLLVVCAIPRCCKEAVRIAVFCCGFFCSIANRLSVAFLRC